jgi:uncharacterized protein YjiK
MKQIFLIVSFFAGGWLHVAQAQPKLKWISKSLLSIPEPSDICRNPTRNTFFIVSDRGFLFETDSLFNPIRRAASMGFDFEAVYADKHFVYAVEERTRKIQQFDIRTLEKVRNVEVRYQGGRNSGYEGIVWNPLTQRFLLITEKSPILIFELDSTLKVQNEVNLKDNITGIKAAVDLRAPSKFSVASALKDLWRYSVPSDVSSVTFFAGKLFLLSDEDSEILQIHPSTYALEKRWPLGILNPEGFYFLPDGSVHVMSDNMQTVYHFPNILNSEGAK